jgi:hypothetical protein
MNDNYTDILNYYLKISKLIKGGIMFQYVYNEHFNDLLKDIYNIIKLSDNDSKTDIIFKKFVEVGNMTDAIQYMCLPNKVISDTLYYKQSSNIKLTLLAKTLYSTSGTQFKDFLKWQVNVIIRDGKIDIKQEFIKWRTYVHNNDPIGKNYPVNLRDIEETFNNLE